MNFVFVMMLAVGIVVMIITKGGDAALNALLSGAGEAVTLCLSMCGAYIFWMGFMGVVKKSGLMDGLSKLLSPAMRFLFPNAGEAAAAISMNISANMLGMGNAATPFGIAAMRQLEQENPHPGTATYDMCAFIAINASALQLLPTGVLALREAAGSAAPADIVLPAILATACSTLTAIILCRWILRSGGGRA